MSARPNTHRKSLWRATQLPSTPNLVSRNCESTKCRSNYPLRAKQVVIPSQRAECGSDQLARSLPGTNWSAVSTISAGARVTALTSYKYKIAHDNPIQRYQTSPHTESSKSLFHGTSPHSRRIKASVPDRRTIKRLWRWHMCLLGLRRYTLEGTVVCPD